MPEKILEGGDALMAEMLVKYLNEQQAKIVPLMKEVQERRQDMEDLNKRFCAQVGIPINAELEKQQDGGWKAKWAEKPESKE